MANLASKLLVADLEPDPAVRRIEELDAKLTQAFNSRLIVQSAMTRQLVSFQANKSRPVHRWYKYKEAFSSGLVDYFISKYDISNGKVLDPFAGIGTTLFAASASGLAADGIELLPIGQHVIAARKTLALDFTAADFEHLERWIFKQPWKHSTARVPLLTIRITNGAYPPATIDAVEGYLACLANENDRVQSVLRFALLCILESVSFTRKDGQYLRWDHRSARREGKRPFSKGLIADFDTAITSKLREIIDDCHNISQNLPLFPTEEFSKADLSGEITLLNGSSLMLLPKIAEGLYSGIITSPPYCNRYDYTRTYALELALLGVDEQEIVSLRQQMLSCTVENRAKDLLAINPHWLTAIKAADSQELLQAILTYLETQNDLNLLNNKGIPRMVRGYFYEMACIIAECARVLKPNAPLVMVNDNVRYAGISISVDLILSDLASQLGFVVEKIFVLPKGKGNSSQQMGRHGRDALRKCIYVWRKA